MLFTFSPDAVIISSKTFFTCVPERSNCHILKWTVGMISTKFNESHFLSGLGNSHFHKARYFNDGYIISVYYRYSVFN